MVLSLTLIPLLPKVFASFVGLVNDPIADARIFTSVAIQLSPRSPWRSSISFKYNSLHKSIRYFDFNSSVFLLRINGNPPDAKGSVQWNQTFEIQDVILAVSNDTVAIGEYNGRSIYLADSERLIGEITTAMPIRNLAVSEAGYVAAVLADTDVTWINVYDSSGELKWEGRTHMDDSGYPMALSMSPGGELLMVAYIYVDAGILRTKVGVYNLGAVGSNVSDRLVSTYAYTDMLIPCVRFLNDDTAFAVGDGRLSIYTGSHIPVEASGHLYDREIRSVFYSDRYVGLVFLADNSENRYQLKVYDTTVADAGGAGGKDFYFDIDYTDIFFGKDNFVIYNDTECLVMTMDGIEKFHGDFRETVRLMVPAGNAYRYLLVTDDSINTIQLK